MSGRASDAVWAGRGQQARRSVRDHLPNEFRKEGRELWYPRPFFMSGQVGGEPSVWVALAISDPGTFFAGRHSL
jgi:hypothetical protein